MKVQNDVVQLGGLNSAPPMQGSKNATHGAHHHARAQDQVALSPFARLSSSDPARIDQLTAAYQAGSYNVPPAKVAASMIDDAFFR